jgi:DNA-binding NtrC family response regulator
VVELPPLRDRLGDVPLIAQRILDELEAEEGGTHKLGEDAVAALMRRQWPGNVRELRNVLKRAVVLASSPVISASDLGPGTSPGTSGPLRDSSVPAAPSAAGAEPSAIEVGEELPIKDARDRWVAPMEREYLLRVIKRCNGDLDKAAEEAGIHRKSLERLLRQHGLKAGDFRD